MPQSHQPTVDPFVGPTKAFEAVGREIFGDAWRADCINDPTDAAHKKAKAILRGALRAGEVEAYWETLDYRSHGDLRPQDVGLEFFRIQLKDDLVFHPGANEPVRCHIHEKQLIRFLRGEKTQPLARPQREMTHCLKWLIDILPGADRNKITFEVLRRMAREQFPGVSNNAFTKLRKTAIDETGRHDLAKPGRRKNPISE